MMPLLSELRDRHPHLMDTAEVLLTAVIISWFLLTYVVAPAEVNGISMQPTLQPEQHLVMEKVSIPFTEPYARGDVIVFRVEGKENALIKRIIAVPGDVIEVREHILYINGEEQTGYVPNNLEPSQINPRFYFVEGDNRDYSNDSRSPGVGLIYVGDIVGRAMFRYWPLETFGPIN